MKCFFSVTLLRPKSFSRTISSFPRWERVECSRRLATKPYGAKRLSTGGVPKRLNKEAEGRTTIRLKTEAEYSLMGLGIQPIGWKSTGEYRTKRLRGNG
jgi:hypothetical protein